MLFSFSSIQEYKAQLRAGDVSCLEAVQFYLDRIESRKHLNAFVNIYAEEALEKAKSLDKKRKESGKIGKLHGLIVGLKDVICYKDHPISASSKILKNYISPYNATVVQKLLDEDAIIIGHLNCDEFAMGSTNENSAYGKVLNPVDESRVPGGSSGGSAVALQAGLCMVTLGTDTGGSVRQPANFCGILGFKPSYGCISRYGVIAYASSFDQVGVFANSLEDIVTVTEVIAGSDEFDSTLEPDYFKNYFDKIFEKKSRTYKIGFFKEALDHEGLDPDVREKFTNFIETLKNDGHEVQPIEFDYLEYIVPTYYVLTTAEASSNLSRYDGIRYGSPAKDSSEDLTTYYKRNRSAGFGTEVKRRILLGSFVLSSGYYDAYFQKAQAVRKKLLKKTQLIFREFEAVILPVTPSTAFKFGENSDDPVAMYLADIYTVYANLVGIPAISLPLFKTKGLPQGLQIMTDRFQELSLLQFSHQMMQQYKSFDR